MRRARLWSAAAVLAATAAFPTAASAGIIDFIWEMSGPQMVGTFVHCEYDVESKRTECRFLGKRFAGNAGSRSERRLWITLTGGAYISTGADSDLKDFEFGKVRIYSFEPTIDFLSHGSDDIAIHHGVGLTTFVVEGSDFDAFTKVGVKFVPLAVTFRYLKGLNLAYNLRFFPDGFTSDEFGPGRLTGIDRRPEFVDSLTIGWGYQW